MHKRRTGFKFPNGNENSDPYAGGQDIGDGRKTMWTQREEEVNGYDPARRSFVLRGSGINVVATQEVKTPPSSAMNSFDEKIRER